jgi:Electron transfer DM13
MNKRSLMKFSATLVALVGAVALMAQTGKIVATGTFHGAAHSTSGRATVYSGENGALTLRLTSFKTSNGPNLHVLLIAASDADDNEDFLKKGIERVDLGSLKGNEGDQNYDVPAGTDLEKYKAVSIFCERFNVNFGAAPLAK